jgi:tetratricopeptide (TPR) repeat protein
MKHRSPRILFGLLLAGALSLDPAFAIIDEDPPPAPPSDSKGGTQPRPDEKKQREEAFREGYMRARTLILEGRYEAAIAALTALGRDDHPDVANLIGFASRKLNRYEDAKRWYERALAADPAHVRTWSYYGMWHAEQGNALKAMEYLERVRLLCGRMDCREYQELKGVIEGTRVY